MEKQSPRQRFLADFGLMATALVWGSNFVVVKETLPQVPPMLFLGFRFGIAFLFLAPFLASPGRRPARRLDWVKATVTGLFLFAGFAAQILGQQFTTPGMSGFLTGIYVVLVPLFGIILTRRFTGWPALAAAGLVAVGLGFLFLHGQTAFGRGEILTLACAVFFALHFLALGRWSPDMDPFFLTAVQLLVTAAAGFAAAGFSPAPALTFSRSAWAAILYTALLGSLGAYLMQTWAQRHTPAHHAAIILSLESVFAVLCSLVWGTESLTLAKVAGFAFIMAGILVAESGWRSIRDIASMRNLFRFSRRPGLENASGFRTGKQP